MNDLDLLCLDSAQLDVLVNVLTTGIKWNYTATIYKSSASFFTMRINLMMDRIIVKEMDVRDAITLITDGLYPEGYAIQAII